MISAQDKNDKIKQVPGMACPQCGRFIPITITELLTSSCIRCSYCLFKLNIDTRRSTIPADVLNKIEDKRKQIDSLIC